MAQINFHKLRPWLALLFVTDALGLGWVTIEIIYNSTGSGSAILFGLSLASLVLTGLTLLSALGLLAIALFSWRNHEQIYKLLGWLLKHPAWSIGSLLLVFATAWILAWTPAERFGDGYYYALRLLPIARWLAFFAATGAFFLLAGWRGFHAANWRNHLRQNRSLLISSSLALTGIALVAWLAANRIFDVTFEEEDFWYGAGVPVLAWQVLFALIIGAATAWSEKFLLPKAGRWPALSAWGETLLFIAIWVITGSLWASIPPTSSFMISEPYPPNFDYFPASDGQSYDLASQYALIGQRLYNGGKMVSYFERPLYPTFLFYLHLVAGQNISLLLALQAAVFGVLPALAYLIGKEIHSRWAGTILATILALRGSNGLLLGGLLENANQKMFLTDFPTGIGLMLIILLAIRWAKKPQEHWRLAGWVSGCIGLWGLVRPHMIFLLPVAGLLALVLYIRRKRVLIALAGFMVAAYLAAVMPWMQLNGSGVSLFEMYANRVRSIIQERYQIFPPLNPNGATETMHLASLDPISPGVTPQSKPLSEAALDHFLNNLTHSALSLPGTLTNLDLVTVIKKSETYWKPYWDGTLSPSARVWVPINLTLIALGIGLAWKNARSPGWFPLAGMLIFYLINSLARTSGGRYLVPADWVLILYYTLGLLAVFEFAAAWFNKLPETTHTLPVATPNRQDKPLWQGLGVILLLGGLGSLMPIASYLYSPRYELLDKYQLAAKIDQDFPGRLGLNAAELQAFLDQDEALVVEGRVMYPRHIGRNLTPGIPDYLFDARLYPRITFITIGQHGERWVLMPTSKNWFPLPQGADVLVVGCLRDGYLDGWAILLPGSGEVHLRLPSAKLTCPLPEPTCNNNGNCK